MTPILFGYFGNDVALARSAFSDVRDAFRVSDSDGATAWGLGSLQEGLAVVKRRPGMSDRLVDFGALTCDLPSRVSIGAVLGSADRSGTDSIPPFRYHNWLLGVKPRRSGSLSAQSRAAVRQTVPDHLRRSKEGESDAELIALALMSRFFCRTDWRSPEMPARLVAEHLLEGVATLVSAAGEDRLELDGMFSNGKSFIAVAHSTPIFWKRFEGLADDEAVRAERQALGLVPRLTPRAHFRGILLSTRIAPELEAWSRLEPGQVLSYEHQTGPEILEFDRQSPS
jgi:hypothetical protein